MLEFPSFNARRVDRTERRLENDRREKNSLAERPPKGRLQLSSQIVERPRMLVPQRSRIAGQKKRPHFPLRFGIGLLSKSGQSAMVLQYGGGVFQNEIHLVKQRGNRQIVGSERLRISGGKFDEPPEASENSRSLSSREFM